MMASALRVVSVRAIVALGGDTQCRWLRRRGPSGAPKCARRRRLNSNSRSNNSLRRSRVRIAGRAGVSIAPTAVAAARASAEPQKS